MARSRISKRHRLAQQGLSHESFDSRKLVASLPPLDANFSGLNAAGDYRLTDTPRKTDATAGMSPRLDMSKTGPANRTTLKRIRPRSIA